MDTVKVFDRKFSELGVIGNFTYLKYSREFRGAGEAELRIPLKGDAPIPRPDGYITVPDGTMYRVISVERDLREGTVTAHCRGLLAFLEGTVIPEEYYFDGDAAALLYSLVRRGASNLPKAFGLGGTVSGRNVQISSGRSRLYDDLVSLCYMGELGMSMEYNGSKLVFTVHQPRDRTSDSDDPVTVSRRLGTFDSERLLWDFGSYYNVAVVSGAEKESGGRYTVTVTAAETDLDGDFPDSDYYTREIQVNYTVPLGNYTYEDESGEKVLNETAYTAAMAVSGAAALGRCRPKLYLYGGTDITSSGIDVGDVVTVGDSDTGLFGEAMAERIVTEYSDEGKRVTTELCAKLTPEILE